MKNRKFLIAVLSLYSAMPLYGVIVFNASQQLYDVYLENKQNIVHAELSPHTSFSWNSDQTTLLPLSLTGAQGKSIHVIREITNPTPRIVTQIPHSLWLNNHAFTITPTSYSNVNALNNNATIIIYGKNNAIKTLYINEKLKKSALRALIKRLIKAQRATT